VPGGQQWGQDGPAYVPPPGGSWRPGVPRETWADRFIAYFESDALLWAGVVVLPLCMHLPALVLGALAVGGYYERTRQWGVRFLVACIIWMVLAPVLYFGFVAAVIGASMASHPFP
jgi:hypothetical protein